MCLCAYVHMHMYIKNYVCLFVCVRVYVSVCVLSCSDAWWYAYSLSHLEEKNLHYFERWRIPGILSFFERKVTSTSTSASWHVFYFVYTLNVRGVNRILKMQVEYIQFRLLTTCHLPFISVNADNHAVEATSFIRNIKWHGCMLCFRKSMYTYIQWL